MATRGHGAAIPTVRRSTAPAATGLSVRPDRRSRSASSQSLTQPTASWLASDGRGDRRATPGRPMARRPRRAAPCTAVTAAAGSGWLALTSP